MGPRLGADCQRPPDFEPLPSMKPRSSSRPPLPRCAIRLPCGTRFSKRNVKVHVVGRSLRLNDQPAAKTTRSSTKLLVKSEATGDGPGSSLAFALAVRLSGATLKNSALSSAMEGAPADQVLEGLDRRCLKSSGCVITSGGSSASDGFKLGTSVGYRSAGVYGLGVSACFGFRAHLQRSADTSE